MSITLNQYDAAIGILLPFLIAFLSKQSWPGFYKEVAATGTALIIAVLRQVLDGSFDVANLIGTFFIALGASQATYVALAKGLNIPVFDWLLQLGPIADKPAQEPVSDAVKTEQEKG